MKIYIPDLASFWFPFQDFLKNDAIWKWTKHHERALKELNEKIKGFKELIHFKKQNK